MNAISLSRKFAPDALSTFLELLVGGPNSISNSVFGVLSLLATSSIDDITEKDGILKH